MKTMDRLARRIGRALNHVLAVCALSLCLLAQQAHAGETVTFFHNDNAGSPMLATDINANPAWKETYRPYGDRLIDAAASDNNSVWFTGKPYDEQTGLSYFGARYYDPTIGRFMGIDPAPVDEENFHSPNRYAYANNNPYKYVDPDGRVPLLLLVPVVLKGIDMAITAYDVYQAYKDGGVKGAAIEVGTNAVMNAVPGGKIGGKVVEAVASKAGDVAGAAAGSVGRKGASVEFTTASGNTYTGNSTRSSRTGGEPRAPMHPETQASLDAVKNPSGTHGDCCEIDAINKAKNAGDDVRGGKMGPVKDNQTGEIKPPCSTCREVKKTEGVE